MPDPMKVQLENYAAHEDQGKPLDPMVPFLTGWLTGALLNEGKKCMKIEEITPNGYEGCTIHFASGLKLRVRVEEVEE